MAISIREHYGGSYRIGNLTSSHQLPDHVAKVIYVLSDQISVDPLVQMPRLTSVFRHKGALQHIIVNSAGSDKNFGVALFAAGSRIPTIPEIPPGNLLEISIDYEGTWVSSGLKTYDQGPTA